MNDSLFCSIHVDCALGRDELAALVASWMGGAVARRGVDCAWARIAVDDDYGDSDARQADPDDFLGWRVLLEVMPSEPATRDEVVDGVAGLMRAMLRHGWRVLAQADYADELPGGGEIAMPAPSR